MRSTSAPSGDDPEAGATPGLAPSAAPEAVTANRVLDTVLALAVGAISVLQSRVVGALSQQVESGFEAAAISLWVGLFVISVIVVLTPTARAGVTRLLALLRRPRQISPWLLLGGIGGAAFVSSQGLAVPVVGVALFTVAAVAGLTANSLLADRVGLTPGGSRPITAPRLGAAVLALSGVALAVSGDIAPPGEEGSTAAVIALLVSVVAGALVAFQQGFNGLVAVAAHSPLAAALVNFIVGVTALTVVAVLIENLDRPAYIAPPAPWAEPVLWLGGPMGVAIVVLAAFAIRGLGVLLFSLLTIVGQLVGGVVMDTVAPVSGVAPLTWVTFAAVGLAVAATLLAFVGGRQATGTMSP